MRKTREIQSTIFDIIPDHLLGREYQAISKILDQHPRILYWVAADLGSTKTKATGRRGLSAETILRAAIVKQHHQFSYEELSIHLHDSRTFSAFCRLAGTEPSKSALQEAISSITASTWEKVNRAILVSAQAQGIEMGRVVRTDATPVESEIHKPMDSELLWDVVRVLSRMMEAARESAPSLKFHNRTRACKKRLLELRFHSRKANKKRRYREMIGYTQETMDAARQAITTVSKWDLTWSVWIAEAERILGLAEKVISQTRRRVLQGEAVPANEKILSLFEDHTDLIVKGRQDVTYGHKVSLTTGKSGMVLDLVVEEGNPCDVTRAVPMIERQIEIYGVAPKQCAFDGAYASKANLEEIKALGVKDVMFQKKRGLTIEEMTKSPWVYRKLRNFRAGVESVISCLKRAFGLSRCTWKGWDHFQAYTWASAVSFNLATLGRKLVHREATA